MKSSRKNRILYLYAAAVGFVLLSFVLGLLLGSTRVGISDVLGALFGKSDNPEAKIILLVRLPRTLAALVVGAALSVSGAVLQCVLSNRLASPSVIGVNSGAGLGVTLALAIGTVSGTFISLAAFIGALATVCTVSLASKKWGFSRGTVVLLGVAMNSLLGAISDTVITLVPEVSVLGNDFKVGSFGAVTYKALLPAAALIVISFTVLMTLTNELDVITLGEESARGLGLNTVLLRPVFLVLAALLSGAAVSVAGLLSFIGLIVPHAVRRIFGSSARRLLPASALIGAAFVALSDTLARVLFAPYELPVGIIMAFLGAPFFIFLLIKKKGGHSRA
jgi:iron complex transport system permease protein